MCFLSCLAEADILQGVTLPTGVRTDVPANFPQILAAAHRKSECCTCQGMCTDTSLVAKCHAGSLPRRSVSRSSTKRPAFEQGLPPPSSNPLLYACMHV